MPKLPRVTAKVFASNAVAEDIGQFGSALLGTKVTTGDISEIQALSAYDTGLRASVISERNYPTLQESNGLFKTFSQQIAYLLQSGMPEWDSNTEYFVNQFCRIESTFYFSLSDNNKGNNPTEDTTNWKEWNTSSEGNVSDLPLFTSVAYDHILSGTDAIGWALQGSLITKVYPDAVTKIVELYTDGTDTEYRGIGCKRSTDGRYIADIAQKSAIDELFETSGIADFYILDGVNEQFYLPRTKWFNQFTLDTSLVNNFNEAGLPNITGFSQSILASYEGSSGGALNLERFQSNSGIAGGNLTGYDALYLDASKSNPIYGNSESVQPPSSNKLLYYKVGNTIVNESTIDIGKVLAELQLKADVDLNNVKNPTQAFKTISVGWSMPDYSAGISVNANTPVTAEYHGYLVTEYWYNNGVFEIIVDDKKISGGGSGASVFQVNPIANIVPIKKGSIFKVVPSNSNMHTTSVFYPLLGGNND